ncbi:hypothetical protein LRP_1182 [Ligilactobacillus ruminis]|nr:hypothetical protein LRP_1182 [Ligilactobacillus ruminis]
MLWIGGNSQRSKNSDRLSGGGLEAVGGICAGRQNSDIFLAFCLLLGPRGPISEGALHFHETKKHVGKFQRAF